MRLAFAVRSTDAAQLLVDFINDANVVARYAVAVNATTLPALTVPPANYAQYAHTLADAKLHAMSWTDEMVPSFTAIPTSLVNYNGLVQPQLQVIKTALGTLQTDPQNAPARAAIGAALTTLHTDLTPCLTAVTDLDTWITTYSSELQPDATALAALCASIATAEQADQASIDKLKGSLGNLQTLVADRTELATLDTIGNAVFSIVLSVVGVAVGVPFSGPIAVIIGLGVGIASATFTAFVPIVSPPDYQESLQTIQDDMNAINTEIGSVNTIVGMLQATSDQLTALVTQSSATSSSVADVLAFWQGMQTDLAAMTADLDAILADLSSDAIAEAIASLDAASASWNDLQTTMASLAKMSYDVSEAIDIPAWSPPT